MLAVSRSGETTETLWAVRGFKEGSGKTVLVIICYEDSPLAPEASRGLIAREGKYVGMDVPLYGIPTY